MSARNLKILFLLPLIALSGCLSSVVIQDHRAPAATAQAAWAPESLQYSRRWSGALQVGYERYNGDDVTYLDASDRIAYFDGKRGPNGTVFGGQNVDTELTANLLRLTYRHRLKTQRVFELDFDFGASYGILDAESKGVTRPNERSSLKERRTGLSAAVTPRIHFTDKFGIDARISAETSLRSSGLTTSIFYRPTPSLMLKLGGYTRSFDSNIEDSAFNTRNQVRAELGGVMGTVAVEF